MVNQAFFVDSWLEVYKIKRYFDFQKAYQPESCSFVFRPIYLRLSHLRDIRNIARFTSCD